MGTVVQEHLGYPKLGTTGIEYSEVVYHCLILEVHWDLPKAKGLVLLLGGMVGNQTPKPYSSPQKYPDSYPDQLLQLHNNSINYVLIFLSEVLSGSEKVVSSKN